MRRAAKAKVVLATGGTGGHIYPALALADGLRREGVDSMLLGITGGPEERLAAETGVPFRGVTGGKLDRQRPDPRELARALRGVAAARRILREEQPALVVGFGGFASLPGTAAAAWLRLPLWLNEQNAFPGLVTRLFARRAEQVIASVAAAVPRIRSDRVRVLPYPVDETPFTREEARAMLGLPAEGPVTLVMGGSQGAAALNEAVSAAAHELGHDLPATLHVTGRAHFEHVQAGVPSVPHYQLSDYVDGRAAFAAADLAITRAGIGTLSMAAFNGVPLIMVPLPSAAENHQFHNAQAFHAAGAGVLLPQEQLGNLQEVWLDLLEPARLARASLAMKPFSPAGAAASFTAAVLERLGKESGT